MRTPIPHIRVPILFLGIVADPEETHAVWYGMLFALGIFDLGALTDAEQLNYAEKRHYFWFGEVGMAAILAGIFAVPLGIFLAGRTEISLAFISASVFFLPLFVFLPKLIQRAMKADADAIISAFGKNEPVKQVFWTHVFKNIRENFNTDTKKSDDCKARLLCTHMPHNYLQKTRRRVVRFCRDVTWADPGGSRSTSPTRFCSYSWFLSVWLSST